MCEEAAVFQPDFIIVILGGNSISNNVDNYTIISQCKEFYKILRFFFQTSVIISAQVELRFYKPKNKFNCPCIESFKKRRSELNKCLNRLKDNDSLLMVAGPNRLDNEGYYRDEVHLNRLGLRKYLTFIKSTVDYCCCKFKHSK